MEIHQTSYEFIKKHAWDRPERYEASFRAVRGYVKLLRSFEDLRHLVNFLGRQLQPQAGVIRSRLVCALYAVVRKRPDLRNAVLEVLLFVRRDQLVPADALDPDLSDAVFHSRLMYYVFRDMEAIEEQIHYKGTKDTKIVED